LGAAIEDLGLQITINPNSILMGDWPYLREEPSFSGDVFLTPGEDQQLTGYEAQTVYTDGSVEDGRGGAAAWRVDNVALGARVENPHSSTECELVGLIASLELNPTAVVSDSLTALRWIKGWGTKTQKEVLECQNRDLVRHFILEAANKAPDVSAQSQGS
jgi:hypothetical protein